MKILVLSDSHGDTLALRKILELQRDADFIFFLGDGARDVSHIPDICPKIPIYAVKGNCDFGDSDTPYETLLTMAGKRFFLCHGHTREAKYTSAALRRAAKETEADAVLYGHTHQPFLSYISAEERPYYIFNPGSVARNTAGESHYGIISIVDGTLFFSNAVCRV